MPATFSRASSALTTTAASIGLAAVSGRCGKHERQARSIRSQLHMAKFPVHRDLDSFQWLESPLDEQQIRQLACGGFMEEARN